MSRSEDAREEALNLMSKAVMSDRNKEYGDPEDNFQDIADYYNIYLADKLNSYITPVDVATMLALVKIARLRTSPLKGDHMVDLAGYAVCGYACQRKAERTAEEERGVGRSAGTAQFDEPSRVAKAT